PRRERADLMRMTPVSDLAGSLISDGLGKELCKRIRHSCQAIPIKVPHELAVQCVHIAGVVTGGDLSILGVEDVTLKRPCDASAGPWVIKEVDHSSLRSF